ncbi:MAG: peroxiredoxin [Isosphaeraceae bacterium]|nr:peroxiredoxin [Isosphaeraceae bacterium]
MPGGSVGVGDEAPDFSVTSSDGEPVRLSAFRGHSAVVLFFFPMANTPACTAEACAFRDSYETFVDAGAEVIGVSADAVATQRQFAGRHRLPFRLISDSAGELRTLYGVPKTLGLFPGRVTYVIDPQGIVRYVFSSQLQIARHVEEAIRVLKTLPGGE